VEIPRFPLTYPGCKTVTIKFDQLDGVRAVTRGDLLLFVFESVPMKSHYFFRHRPRAVLMAGDKLVLCFSPIPILLSEIIVTAQRREQEPAGRGAVASGESGGEELRRGASFRCGKDILFLSSTRCPKPYAEGSFGRLFHRFYIRGKLYGRLRNFDLKRQSSCQPCIGDECGSF